MTNTFKYTGLCALLVSTCLYAYPAHTEPYSTEVMSTPVVVEASATPAIPELLPMDGFEQMLIQVYNNHPELKAERETLKIADERVSQAFSGFRPTIYASGSLGEERQKLNNDDWTSGRLQTAALVAEQPLFSGFGTLAEFRAAKMRVQSGRARLLASEQRIFLNAITAWLEVAEKQQILDMNRMNRERMAIYLDATKQRFEAGDSTRTDMAQAESRLADADARLASADANSQNALATYQRVVGSPAQAVINPAFPASLPKGIAEVESMAQNNPELAQVKTLEKAALYDVDAASSVLWPSLSVRGTMSEERANALGIDRLRTDSITLNLTIPLYQTGAEYSRIREAKIVRERNKFNSIDASREVIAIARQAWANYHAALNIITASTTATEASTRALEGVREEQSQGLRTLLDVLDAQSEVLGAEVQHATAQKNARLEAYRLMAATGQLTAEGLRLNTQAYDPNEHYEDVATRWVGF